ncbi:MAG: TetR/AcrR family transcriptional regulator [Parvibaculaceae bacterium]
MRSGIAPSGRFRPDRAEELMEAALHQFASHDFNSVTIKDIAAAIPVNSALIYYYFKNKEELFQASLEHAAKLAIAKYHEMSAGKTDPAELISLWFDNHIESVVLIRYMVKVMLDFAVSHPQRDMIENGVQGFYGAEREILSKSIRKGIKAGLFRKLDADKAAQVASTILDGVIVRSQIQENFDLRTAVEELKNVFWAYLDYGARK